MADLCALIRFCLEAIEGGEPAALITQCGAEGSTPRELGVRMAVTHQEVHGTIGGGNLEHLAIDQAQKLLGDPERKFLLQDHPLGPLLAQCCGGHVRLLIDSLSSADKDWLTACYNAAEVGETISLRTALTHTTPRKSVANSAVSCSSFSFFDQQGEVLSEHRPGLTQCAEMIERFGQKRPQLWLYGAGHVGRATAQIMAQTIFEVACFDSREEERALLPRGIAVRDLEHVDQIVRTAPSDGYHVVFTHSHDLDYAIVSSVLSRGEFAYLGLIGSQTKRSRFLSRLQKDGLDKQSLERLTSPIGTPGIESKAPEAVAISVAHELMSLLGPHDRPID